MSVVTDPILTGKICPYCGKASELIDSAEVYGKSYGRITEIAIARIKKEGIEYTDWKGVE